MLAYLDALVAALAARDTTEIDRLLAHPLARILSPDALTDATAERRAAGTGAPSVAPLRLLQLRYLTAQLLGNQNTANSAGSDDQTGLGKHNPHEPARSHRCAGGRHQMELSLSA